jgi:hypothetical protein
MSKISHHIRIKNIKDLIAISTATGCVAINYDEQYSSSKFKSRRWILKMVDLIVANPNINNVWIDFFVYFHEILPLFSCTNIFSFEVKVYPPTDGEIESVRWFSRLKHIRYIKMETTGMKYDCGIECKLNKRLFKMFNKSVLKNTKILMKACYNVVEKGPEPEQFELGTVYWLTVE